MNGRIIFSSSRRTRVGIAVLCGLIGLAAATPLFATTTVTQFAYDAGNHISKVTDPRGLVTTYSYDGLGQKWQQVSPDTGTTTWSYDGYGRPSSMTRADGVRTSYGYDEISRTTSVTAGGQAQTFTYDSCTHGLGRLCAASDSTGTTSYSYSPEGWVTGRGFSVSGTTYALGYGYNAEGQVASVVYPDGNQAIYTYTQGVVSGVVLNIGGTSVTGASTISYLPMNAGMKSWTSSNGLMNTLTYDTDGRLTGVSAAGVQNLSFSYDAADRIVGLSNGIDNAMSQSFGYDEESRLRSVQSDADNEGLQYDLDGNRLTLIRNGVSASYATSSTSNQLTNLSGAMAASYGYSSQGNASTINGSTVYQYNSFNRLSTAGGLSNYVNPEGQRLAKSNGTFFAPSVDGGLMSESAGGMWIDYLWLNGRLVGRVYNQQVYAIHADQVDRPEVVTDVSRSVVWRARNFAFDRAVTQDVIGGLNLGFPGQYYDNETNTWNNGFRDYDSRLGRYLESDPLGLNSGINTYTYVRNNPLSNIDPFGLRDVIVAIWNSTSITHPGHVFMGEMNGGVILSQFPIPHGMLGPNKTLDWSQTLQAEDGKAPDQVFEVHVSNDQAFDAAAHGESAKPMWFLFSSASTTKCSSSVYDALKAGGLNFMDPGAGVLPDTLGRTLGDLAGFGNLGVARLGAVPW
jgi:RHS repeat-associated protein